MNLNHLYEYPIGARVRFVCYAADYSVLRRGFGTVYQHTRLHEPPTSSHGHAFDRGPMLLIRDNENGNIYGIRDTGSVSLAGKDEVQ